MFGYLPKTKLEIRQQTSHREKTNIEAQWEAPLNKHRRIAQLDTTPGHTFFATVIQYGAAQANRYVPLQVLCPERRYLLHWFSAKPFVTNTSYHFNTVQMSDEVRIILQLVETHIL